MTTMTKQGPSEPLTERLRAGDVQALAEGFGHYREQLHRMIALRLDRRLKSRLSPSDILQEAYIDAQKRVGHYVRKPEMTVLGWLRWIVGQRVVEVHRHHLGAQRRAAGLEIALPHPASSAASLPSLAAVLAGSLTSPSHAAQRNELFAALEAALRSLEPMDREILTLRHFDELSNTEVAEVLGIEKAAASKRYVRALSRLKAVLVDLPGFLDESP